MAAKTKVPAVEGWFTTDPDHPALLGSRCASARPSSSLARTSFCRNPACQGREFAEIELSRTGTIWSFTDNRYQPPPPYVSPEPFEPYTIAAVELADEQMVVLGQVVTGRRRRGPARRAWRSSWCSARCTRTTSTSTWCGAGGRRGRAQRAAGRSPDERRARGRRPGGRACTRGASGAATSSSTASSPRSRRWPTPASTWADIAVRRRGRHHPQRLPGLHRRAPRSARRWAGRATGWPAATPPAPRAPRPSTSPGPRSWPGSATSPW